MSHTTLAALIKIGCSLVFGVLGCYMSECFPSKYRGMAVAIITGFGRLGSFVSPYICDYLTVYNIPP